MKIRIKQLKITNYRGIKEWQTSFGDKVNVVSGKNGAGKSSVLNAISFLLTSETISGTNTNATHKDSIGNEIKDGFQIIASFVIDGQQVIIKRTDRKYYINNNAYSNFKKFGETFEALYGVNPKDLYNSINPILLEEALSKGDKSNGNIRALLMRSINAKVKVVDDAEYRANQEKLNDLAKLVRDSKTKIKSDTAFLEKRTNELSIVIKPNDTTDAVGLVDDEARMKELSALSSAWDEINRLSKIKAATEDSIININNTIKSKERDNVVIEEMLEAMPVKLPLKYLIASILTLGLFWLIYILFIKDKNPQSAKTVDDIKEQTIDDDGIYLKLESEKKVLYMTVEKLKLVPEPTLSKVEIINQQSEIEKRTSQDGLEKMNQKRDMEYIQNLSQGLEKLKDIHNSHQQELLGLKSKKAEDDIKLQKAISELFSGNTIINLFDKNNKPVIKILYDGIEYTDLNNARMKELAVMIADKISSGKKIDTFKLIDNFEQFSSNNFDGQVIAASVSTSDLELNEN